MRRIFGIAVIASILACNQASEKKESGQSDSSKQVSDTTAQADVVWKDGKLNAIFTNYILLKNDLVSTKFEAAKQSADKLAGSLNDYKGCENTAIISKNIAAAKDIKAQRKEFTALSSDLIALFKHADLTSGAIFVQHCPMANNGDGGEWLSAGKNIENPYYGAEMMECGSVIEEIKTK